MQQQSAANAELRAIFQARVGDNFSHAHRCLTFARIARLGGDSAQVAQWASACAGAARGGCQMAAPGATDSPPCMPAVVGRMCHHPWRSFSGYGRGELAS
jgi:hypothetical protein